MAPKRKSEMEFTPKGGAAEADEFEEEEADEERTGGPTLSVEHSKSGKSTCKYCKSAIPLKELRIVSTPTNGDYASASYRHLTCWKAPKNFATSSLAGFSALVRHALHCFLSLI